MCNFCYPLGIKNVFDKTDRALRLHNYSPQTLKTYLFYINEYINFSKKARIKNKQKAIEKFLLDKQNRKQSPQTINLALNAVIKTSLVTIIAKILNISVKDLLK